MNEFPKGVEITCSALIEHDGKILLVRSPKWRNKWLFPGGHIEPGETILDAVVRETAEEVGIRVKPVAIVSYGELINPPSFHRPGHFIYFDVWCTLSSGEVRLDDEELTSYILTTPEEALNMDLAETYDKTIRDYLEYRTRGKP